MSRHGRFGKTAGNRELRRAAVRESRVSRPTHESNVALLRTKGLPSEVRALARVWLRFPGTRASNILSRSNALDRRRAANRSARASRKANRR